MILTIKSLIEYFLSDTTETFKYTETFSILKMDKIFLKYKHLQSRGKELNTSGEKKATEKISLQQMTNTNDHKQSPVDSSVLPASLWNI